MNARKKIGDNNKICCRSRRPIVALTDQDSNVYVTLSIVAKGYNHVTKIAEQREETEGDAFDSLPKLPFKVTVCECDEMISKRVDQRSKGPQVSKTN